MFCNNYNKNNILIIIIIIIIIIIMYLCTSLANCTEGSVRLLAGDDYAYYYGNYAETEFSDYGDLYIKDTLSRGRVEVCIAGRYSAVCDRSWDYEDASVVCRELGFSPYGERCKS